jgi:hypothetical protein
MLKKPPNMGLKREVWAQTELVPSFRMMGKQKH